MKNKEYIVYNNDGDHCQSQKSEGVNVYYMQ